jgi:penicillin-binding protein 1A
LNPSTASPPSKPRPAAPGGGGRRPGPWILAAIIAAVVAAVLVGGGVGIVTAMLNGTPAIPDRESLWAVRRSPGLTFVARDGSPIATRGARYGVRVTLADLPAYAPKAFLAAEDRRFYAHGAMDLRAIARAARRDLAAGRVVEGGSTLSQQLARTLFLKPEHTFRRKVQEAYLAARLEEMVGKDGVLELYLNRTFFGSQAYGLDAAARLFFGVGAHGLTLPQAAMLAALPNAPTRLSPINDYAGAWGRARRILAIMAREGWITPEDAARALADPPALAPPRAGEGEYSYILDQAGAEAGGLAGGAADITVRLTIDPKLQAAALAAVREGVGAGRRRGVSQGALVALAPDGAIRAMVGGLDHDRSTFNRVTQAHRQPGSSFKAFVYGAAMEHGVTPTDIRQDAPVALGRWTPTNYGGRYAGAVSIQTALARSLNTVSVRLTLEVGPDTVAAFARRCGITAIPLHPGPSIALGAYEVTLLQLAGGYQVFQTGGGRTTPYLIESIRTTRGEEVYAHPPSAPIPVYDPLYASRMVRMLEGVIVSGTGVAANIGRPAAGKTGTSQRWRDAWFVGFTPDLLSGVWVGNDDDRPMAGVTGGEIPAHIWKSFMTFAEKGVAPTDFPWLVGEPPAAPREVAVAAAPGVFEDQPPMLDEQGARARPPEEDLPAYESPGDRAGPPPEVYRPEPAPYAEEARRRWDEPDDENRPPPPYVRRPPVRDDRDDADEGPPPRRPPREGARPEDEPLGREGEQRYRY